MRRSTMLCAPLLALVLLAGCDQGGSAGDIIPTDTDASPTAEASAEPTDDGTGQPEAGTGGTSCLAGSWELQDMAEYGVDSIEALGGTFDFTLTFDDGTVSIDITVAAPATDYTEAVDMAFFVEGRYSVSGGTITLSDMTGSTVIDGQDHPIDPGAGFGTMDEGESGFSCSGNTLTLAGEKYSRK